MAHFDHAERSMSTGRGSVLGVRFSRLKAMLARYASTVRLYFVCTLQAGFYREAIPRPPR